MTLPRPLKLTFKILLLTAVGAGLTACNRSNGQGNSASAAASPTPAAIQISTTSAVTRQLPRFFEANGSLAPNQQADVAAETSGKVAAVGVDMGSTVRRGQMIVKLDDADFRIRVQQAQAQLDQAKATLRQNEAKIGLRPGQKFNPRRATSRARPMTNRNHKGISWLSSIRR
jgi:multidrug efflux pump subunit AcrA (membrane-fusion protein)